jgi:hypothetical protein
VTILSLHLIVIINSWFLWNGKVVLCKPCWAENFTQIFDSLITEKGHNDSVGIDGLSKLKGSMDIKTGTAAN